MGDSDFTNLGQEACMEWTKRKSNPLGERQENDYSIRAIIAPKRRWFSAESIMRLIQIKRASVRRVAVVEEPHLRLVDGCSSIYELANIAISTGMTLRDLARQRVRRDVLDYNEIYSGRSEWRILPAFDHPEECARCLISGTGLTHLGSARHRQSMHETCVEEMTDSMKMFQWGVEGGQPASGCAGT